MVLLLNLNLNLNKVSTKYLYVIVPLSKDFLTISAIQNQLYLFDKSFSPFDCHCLASYIQYSPNSVLSIFHFRLAYYLSLNKGAQMA